MKNANVDNIQVSSWYSVNREHGLSFPSPGLFLSLLFGCNILNNLFHSSLSFKQIMHKFGLLLFTFSMDASLILSIPLIADLDSLRKSHKLPSCVAALLSIAAVPKATVPGPLLCSSLSLCLSFILLSGGHSYLLPLC